MLLTVIEGRISNDMLCSLDNDMTIIMHGVAVVRHARCGGGWGRGGILLIDSVQAGFR